MSEAGAVCAPPMEGEGGQRPAIEPTEAPLPAERAFVVQLRAQADPRGNLFTGRVEHMASGTAVRFDSAEDLLAFITRVLAPAGSSK